MSVVLTYIHFTRRSHYETYRRKLIYKNWWENGTPMTRLWFYHKTTRTPREPEDLLTRFTFRRCFSNRTSAVFAYYLVDSLAYWCLSVYFYCFYYCCCRWMNSNTRWTERLDTVCSPMYLWQWTAFSRQFCSLYTSEIQIASIKSFGIILSQRDRTFYHYITSNRWFFVFIAVVVKASLKIQITKFLVLVACIITNVMIITARGHLCGW